MFKLFLIQRMPPGASWTSETTQASQKTIWNCRFSQVFLYSVGFLKTLSDRMIHWGDQQAKPFVHYEKTTPPTLKQKEQRNILKSQKESANRFITARNCNRVFRLWNTKLKNEEARNRWLGRQSHWNLCIKDKEIMAQNSPKSSTYLLAFEKASRSQSV